MGCVTDEWAQWVQNAATGDGEEKPEFVKPPRVASEEGKILPDGFKDKRDGGNRVFKGFIDSKRRRMGLDVGGG